MRARVDAASTAYELELNGATHRVRRRGISASIFLGFDWRTPEPQEEFFIEHYWGATTAKLMVVRWSMK